MRSRLVLAVAALLLMLVGGVAYAAIPHSVTGVITGCRHNSNGSLRVIDAQAGAICAGNETTLTWPSQQKLSGVTTVINAVTLAPNENQGFGAGCPAGKVVTGGGYTAHAPGIDVHASAPSVSAPGEVPTTWVVAFRNNTAESVNVQVFAICAN